MLRKAALLAAVCLAGIWSGCGSSNSGMSTPTPTRTTPSPTPTPNPSTGPDSFFATLARTAAIGVVPAGQVTVDASANNGVGNVQISNGLGLTSTQALQFCPFGGSFINCITIPVTPATIGSNFQFPSTGAFSGVFQVLENGQQSLVTSMGGTTGVSFQAALLPVSTITFGIGTTTGVNTIMGTLTGAAPISSGSVMVTGQTIHVVINGTTPSQTFSVSTCTAFGTSACQTVGSVVSNTTGSVVADVAPSPSGFAGVVLISDSAGAEFVSGFRVQ
jgi:hypothetical protein